MKTYNIYISEWFIAASLLGFKRVFEFGLANEIIDSSYKNNFKVFSDHAEFKVNDFSDNLLKSIVEAYIAYGSNRFSRIENKLMQFEKVVHIIDNLLLTEENVFFNESNCLLDDLKQNFDAKKILSDYKNGCKTLISKKILTSDKDDLAKAIDEAVDDLKEQLKIPKLAKRVIANKKISPAEAALINSENICEFKKALEKLKATFEMLITLFRTPEFVRDYNFSTFAMNKQGQTSIFNVCKKNCLYEEYVDIFYEDYVVPIIKSYEFEVLLSKPIDVATLDDFVRTNHGLIKDTFWGKDLEAFHKGLKKEPGALDISKALADYIHNNTLNCQLIAGEFASEDYSEKHIYSLGTANINKQFTANKISNIPISSFSIFLLLFFEFGVLNRHIKIKDDFKRELTFLLTNNNLDQIFKDNITFQLQETKNVFSSNIVTFMEHKLNVEKAKLKGFKVIDIIISDNNQDKSLIVDHIYTPDILHLFLKELSGTNYNYHKRLKYEELDDFNTCLLYNQNCKAIISKKIKQYLVDPKPYLSLENIVFSYLILDLLKETKGGIEMDQKIKVLQSAFISGKQLKPRLGEKARTLSFNMLSFINTNDKERFISTYLKMIALYNLQVPQSFLDVINEEIDFKDFASAFIAGLNSFGKNGGATADVTDIILSAEELATVEALENNSTNQNE